MLCGGVVMESSAVKVVSHILVQERTRHWSMLQYRLIGRDKTRSDSVSQTIRLQDTKSTLKMQEKRKKLGKRKERIDI